MAKQSLRNSADHGVFRRSVQQQLLSRILAGKYPPGHRFILNNIAAEMQVSITPVREALLDLAALGMVDFRPNAGAEAKQFGTQELNEIYHLRRILEVEATRSACGNIPVDKLLQIDRESRNLLKASGGLHSLPEAIALDLRLHGMIADYCGNGRLRSEIQRYDVLIQAIRETLGNRNHVMELATVEHQRVIRALLANDADRAATAMARHIERARDDVAGMLWSGRGTKSKQTNGRRKKTEPPSNP